MRMTDMSPAADIVDEGVRLVSVCTSAGVPLRLLGGVAVRLQCPSAARAPFARSYGDLDVAAPRRSGRLVTQALERCGYVADRRFNALHGDKRLIFMEPQHERKIDVFLGAFQMCHTLELDDRLAIEPLTLSPADLLLTKLQIVQLNTKDALDVLALFTDHPVADAANPATQPHGEQAAVMDSDYVARICGADWGWYATVTDNLDKITQIGADLLEPTAFAGVNVSLQNLRALIHATPKSMKWKLRAGIGRRMQWYEEPEEVRR